MQLDLGLIADDAIKGEGGKLYIFGEFRVITTQAVPARHGRFAIVARFIAPKPEIRIQPQHHLEIEIVNQDGEPTSLPKSPKLPLKFEDYGPANRSLMQAVVIVKIDGLILGQYGDHSIHFFVDERPCGNVAFHVDQAKPKPAK